MSFAPICVELNSSGNQDVTPYNNTCAWPAGNYSTEARSNISACCGASGPSNSIYIQDLPNEVTSDCYQICNITSNGTATELVQHGQTLFDCLNGTLQAANAGHPYCTFNGTTVPKKNDARGLELGWVKIGAMVILVGTALGGL
jgi:hypothetical protein